MRFTKMQGCGNDYIYVNNMKEALPQAGEAAKRFSDRHFGIGADGLVLIAPSKKADFLMSMYNADGSVGAMCGNGIRCLGKYVYEKGLTDKTSLRVETKAGVRKLRLMVEEGVVTSVKVNMGVPKLLAKDIPVVSCSEMTVAPWEVVLQRKLTVLGQEYELTCISMGNPHAVIFLPDKADGADSSVPDLMPGMFGGACGTDCKTELNRLPLERLGPAISSHPMFPDGVNVEFVRVADAGRLQMRVWERGSEETLSCGTGACAAAVAGFLTGRCQYPLIVEQPGGTLKIASDPATNEIWMEGPAVTVFEGEL